MLYGAPQRNKSLHIVIHEKKENFLRCKSITLQACLSPSENIIERRENVTSSIDIIWDFDLSNLLI